MDKDRLDRLVLDSLYYRRATNGDSCFVSNVAGLELFKCDSSALEHIERVLQEVVVPRPASHIRDEFLGLDYVLGAYAIIGSRYDPSRVVAFVRTMPAALVAEFVAVLPIFFRQRDDKYDFDVAPAPELVAFAEECGNSNDEPLRTAARRAISFLTSKGRGSPEVLRVV
ncbi:MAG: hypothetical protein ACREHD_23315 [Pirellulales bacterium]